MSKKIEPLVSALVLTRDSSILLAGAFVIVTALFIEGEYLSLFEDFLGLGGDPLAIISVVVGKLTVGKFLEKELSGLVVFGKFESISDRKDLFASEA